MRTAPGRAQYAKHRPKADRGVRPPGCWRGLGRGSSSWPCHQRRFRDRVSPVNLREFRLTTLFAARVLQRRYPAQENRIRNLCAWPCGR